MRPELDSTAAPEGGATGAPDLSGRSEPTARPPADPGTAAMPARDPIAPADPPAAPAAQMPRGVAALDVVCPYLRSPGGTWRGTRPQRDHRCWAQSPPAPLSTLTQSSLCLTLGHAGCGIYAAAVQRRAADLASDRIAPERLSNSRFGALVQPVPLAMDAVGERGLPSAPADRTRLARVALVGIVAVVLLSVAIYVLGSQPAATAPIVGLASPTAGAAVPSGTLPATLVPSPVPTIRASSPPTASPIPTVGPLPSPAILRTYRVKPGDTLTSIARRFNVTKAALRAVNSPGVLQGVAPGQVINIPAS